MSKLRLLLYVVSVVFFFGLPEFGLAEAWYNSNWLNRVPITIPSGKVASDLSNFPLYFNITDTNLASAKTDGSDIRATAVDKITEIPLQVLSFDKTTGHLIGFVKLSTLSAGSNNTFYLYWNNAVATAVASTTAYGSQNVWNSSYQAAYLKPLSGRLSDETSVGNILFGGTTTPYIYSTSSPSMGSGNAFRQGAWYDGTDYWLIDTNRIVKRATINGADIISQLNPHTALNAGTDHLGAGMVYGNYLYVPVLQFASCVSFSHQYISLWNISDLSLNSRNNITAQGTDVSALTIIPTDGTNGIIYVTSYCDGSKIWKYDLANYSFLGTIALSSSIPNIQGLTYDSDYFYISSGKGGDSRNNVYKVAKDGTVIGPVLRNVPGNVYEPESVQMYNGRLLYHYNNTSYTDSYLLTYESVENIFSPIGLNPLVAASTTALSVNYTAPDAGTVSMWYNPKLFYNYNSIIDNSVNENYWESWVDVTGTLTWRIDGVVAGSRPVYALSNMDAWYFLNFAWTKAGSNVDIKMYVNGTQQGGTKTMLWRNPGTTFGIAAANVINNRGLGLYSSITLQNTETSPAWISAEYNNQNSPSTFYSVGTFETDTTAPGVSLTYPAVSITASGTITLVATTTDNIAVAGVTFYRGTTAISSEVTATSSPDTYSLNWDTTGVSDGAYSITAVSRDTSSNYATTSAVTITVENNTPTVTTPTPVISTSHSSGSSVSSQVQNLLVMGNKQLADTLMKQYPNSFPISAKPGVMGAGNFVFIRSWSFGEKGEEVRQIQKFLNSQGFPIAKAGPGSPGQETIVFGYLTKSAVIRFQRANNINPIGVVGPVTRQKIAELTVSPASSQVSEPLVR